MNRLHHGHYLLNGRVPRRRGDEPGFLELLRDAGKCSPQARG